MKVGDKVYCKKDNNYYGSICHKSGRVYIIESFFKHNPHHSYGTTSIDIIPIENIRSIFITAEPNTMPKDVYGYSVDLTEDRLQFNDHFISIKELRKLKLKKINEESDLF